MQRTKNRGKREQIPFNTWALNKNTFSKSLNSTTEQIIVHSTIQTDIEISCADCSSPKARQILQQ